MSDNSFETNKPEDDLPLVEEVKAKAYQVYEDTSPEVKEAVEKSKTFYEAHQREIHAALIGLVALKIYKRKVAKTTAKAVVKALAKQGPMELTVNVPDMFDVWRELKLFPDTAYFPPGGGMAHLLGPSKDVIVTVFGNFEKMSNQEIFDYASRALGIRR